MTERERVIATLARAVSDHKLTEQQAADILRAYDAGETAARLPIPPAEAGQGLDEDEIALALLLLLALWREEGATIPATFAARLSWARRLADGFQADARALAARLGRGELTLAEWQRSAETLIRRNIIQQARMGGGLQASRASAQGLRGIYQEQAAYLSRFADEIAAREMAGLPMSEAQIGQRTGLYAGRGYGQFFREYETSGDGAAGWGWVYRYEARDDNRTCYPCAEAEGYYLPGDGPYPGEVCLGGGHCRCSRWPEYNPAVYVGLTGG